MPVTASVVTPFYNTAKYLEECICSVLAQSWRDFEYILVNNCSTDGSREIAARYAQMDPRIRLVDNDRLLEQVPNYNHALEQISTDSRYCKLVQADDWIYPSCLQEMITLADSDPSIGVVSSYRLVGRTTGGTGLTPPSVRALTTVASGREVCRMQLLEERFYFGSPTTVLYRADIVRGRRPFYALGRLHEDTEACYEILRTWNFGFVHQVLSFSRTENDSIMSRARQFNSGILDRLTSLRMYGDSYLSPEEFAHCWRRQEARYLRFLAEAKLSLRGEDFWNYHRRGTATVGYLPSKPRIYAHMLSVLLDVLLNPKLSLERAWSIIRQRIGRFPH